MNFKNLYSTNLIERNQDTKYKSQLSNYKPQLENRYSTTIKNTSPFYDKRKSAQKGSLDGYLWEKIQSTNIGLHDSNFKRF